MTFYPLYGLAFSPGARGKQLFADLRNKKKMTDEPGNRFMMSTVYINS